MLGDLPIWIGLFVGGGLAGYCLRAAAEAHAAVLAPPPPPRVRLLPLVEYSLPGSDPTRTAARLRLKVAAEDAGLTEADLNTYLQRRWPGAVWIALTTAQARAALRDLEAAQAANDLD